MHFFTRCNHLEPWPTQHFLKTLYILLLCTQYTILILSLKELFHIASTAGTMQSWWWLIWPPDERHTRADLIISRSILSGYAVDLPVYYTARQGNPQSKCEKQGVGICVSEVTFDTSATQGRESDSQRALCQATLFDWQAMDPLFIVLLWMYKRQCNRDKRVPCQGLDSGGGCMPLPANPT